MAAQLAASSCSCDAVASNTTTLRSAGYSFVFPVEAQPASLSFVEIERFSTRTTSEQRTRAYGGIATDLNGDRFPDISITNEITADLRVFMSQADGTGSYREDRYRTSLTSGKGGLYRFGTVLPGQYSSQKHIHISASHAAHGYVNTEILFKGDPILAGAKEAIKSIVVG